MNALLQERQILEASNPMNGAMVTVDKLEQQKRIEMLTVTGSIKKIDDIATLDLAKRDDRIKIDLSKVKKNIAKLAQLGFIPGSKVGLITSLIASADVLMDLILNKQFLKPGTTEVDMLKFSKLFILGEKEDRTSSSYESIFAKKHYEMTDIFGRRHLIVAAFKSDIAAFDKAIKSLYSLSQEDLVRIGQDLEILGRVLQELEIDSAKDPSKMEGVTPLDSIMNTSATAILSKRLNFYDNLDALKEYKRNRLNNKKVEDVDFKFGITYPHLTLDNLREYIKEEQDRFLKSPGAGKMDKDQINKRLAKIQRDALKECVIVDQIGELAISLSKVYNTELNKIAVLYKSSDMDLFEKYDVELVRVNEPEAKYARETEAVSVFKMQEMIINMYDMINSTFTHKGAGLPKADILAPLMRRAYYTAGTKRGFDVEDLFSVGVYMAGKTISKKDGKLADNSSFRFKAMELMFGEEVKWDLNPEVMNTAVMELDLPVGYELELNENLQGVIELVDGQAEVEIDGQIDYINCLSDDEYTGYVLVEVVDGEVVFKAYVDQFEFEELEFLLINQLTDLTSDSTVSDLEIMAQNKVDGTTNVYFGQCAKINTANTMDMNEHSKTLYLNKISKQTDTWSKLATVATSGEGFTVKFAAENGVHTMYAANEAGRVRLFGRGVASNMGKGSTTVYATPVGALVVYK